MIRTAMHALIVLSLTLGARAQQLYNLGVLGSSASSAGLAVNSGGTAATGYSGSASGSTNHPFLWTPAGGLVDLGALPGAGQTRATAVSADSAVVVGWSGSESGAHAFRWTPASGLQALPAPP